MAAGVAGCRQFIVPLGGSARPLHGATAYRSCHAHNQPVRVTRVAAWPVQLSGGCRPLTSFLCAAAASAWPSRR